MKKHYHYNYRTIMKTIGKAVIMVILAAIWLGIEMGV